MFLIPKIETANKIGMDNKKDIFAESTLLKFNNLPAVIAIPDLLTPGINENTCKIPIKNADLIVKSFLIFFICLNLSLMYRKIPNIIVAQVIVSKFLILLINPVSAKKKPTIITGSEEIKIFINRALFLKKSKISF